MDPVKILLVAGLVIYLVKRARRGSAAVPPAGSTPEQLPAVGGATRGDTGGTLPRDTGNDPILLITGGAVPPGVKTLANKKKVTSVKVDSSGAKPRPLTAQEIKQAIRLIDGWGDPSNARDYLTKPGFIITAAQRAELETAIANNPAPPGHIPGEMIKKG